MASLNELKAEARERQISGRSTLGKAQLEIALGYIKSVPEHLPFLEVLALDYERFATWLEREAADLRDQLDKYPYDTDLSRSMARWADTNERGAAEARERADAYRKQLQS